MNTMEILTLLLVIFAALSYIDNHNDKRNKSILYRTKFRMLIS